MVGRIDPVWVVAKNVDWLLLEVKIVGKRRRNHLAQLCWLHGIRDSILSLLVSSRSAAWIGFGHGQNVSQSLKHNQLLAVGYMGDALAVDDTTVPFDCTEVFILLV